MSARPLAQTLREQWDGLLRREIFAAADMLDADAAELTRLRSMVAYLTRHAGDDLPERLRLNADCDTHQSNRDLRCEAAREIARLRSALEWYGERAADLVRYMTGSDKTKWSLSAIEAVLVELSLDAGTRARAALEQKEQT